MNAKWPTIEDLAVWQLAKDIAVLTYATCRKSPVSQDYAFRDQMQRAAVSISSNIAEGFEKDSEKDDIRMLQVAKGSAGELRSQLRLATEVQLLDFKDSDPLIRKCQAVSAMLANLIKAKRRSMIP